MFRRLRIVDCITEDLTVLLTPITYVYIAIWWMSLCHLCHICRICHLWHIWHLACNSHIYDNTGVKRSVWTSGMHPNMRNHIWNLRVKMKNPSDLFFPLYFIELLYPEYWIMTYILDQMFSKLCCKSGHPNQQLNYIWKFVRAVF